MFHTDIRKCLTAINTAHSVLLIMHKNPDGDTTGSALALAQYCDKIGVIFDIICKDIAPEHFSFLPLFSRIKLPNEVSIKTYDTIIVCDSGSLSFAGVEEIITPMKGVATIINIDHHATNDMFGNINIVMSEKSSTCEVVSYIFNETGVEVSSGIATCLLNGIITDTGFFNNANASAETLACAAKLLKAGARYNTITKKIFEDKNQETLLAWGDVLSNIEINKKYNTAFLCIPFELGEQTSGLSNFLMNIDGVERVLVLKDLGNGTIKGSLRTTNTRGNVKKLAEFLGGGGHVMASGFVIPGKLVSDETGKWRVE